MNETCFHCKRQLGKLEGRGHDKDDNTTCYSCCRKQDAESLKNAEIGEKFSFYLVKNEITNWPGTLRIPILNQKEGRHNIAGKRIDFWFFYEGKTFWGLLLNPDCNQCARIQRIKDAK